MSWSFGGNVLPNPSMGEDRTTAQESEGVLPNETNDLLVFGYSCTIFRDDERAGWIDQGEHLIPWMGDESLKIDRYDCRLLFHDVSQFEEGPSLVDPGFSDEENLEEQICDFERYQDLSEDQLDQELYMEEDLKRKAGRGAEFYYCYDDNGDSIEGSATSTSKAETKDDKNQEDDEDNVPYVAPRELRVPVGMDTPPTVKDNAIIERTAVFVAEQGTQMEIIIKAKQKSNRNFAFLDWDHRLNSYYRHMLKMVKEKKYQPQLRDLKQTKAKGSLVSYGNDQDSGSDSDNDGNYLHPSLLGGASKESTSATGSPRVGTPNQQNSYKLGEENDVYSALYKKLAALMPKREIQIHQHNTETCAQQMPEECSQHSLISSTSAPQLTNSGATPYVPPQSYADWYQWFYGIMPQYPHQPPVIPPPPDLQPVVDKTAEFVGRFGPKAEEHLKQRPELQLDFLHATHPYYSYYQMKVRWMQYEEQIYNGDSSKTELTLNPIIEEQPSSSVATDSYEATASESNKNITSLVASEAGSPHVIPTTTTATEIPKVDIPKKVASRRAKFAPVAAANVPPAPRRKRRIFHDGPIPPNVDDEPPKKSVPVPISFTIRKEKQETNLLPRSSALQTDDSTDSESENENESGEAESEEQEGGTKEDGKKHVELGEEVGEAEQANFVEKIPEIEIKGMKSSINNGKASNLSIEIVHVQGNPKEFTAIRKPASAPNFGTTLETVTEEASTSSDKLSDSVMNSKIAIHDSKIELEEHPRPVFTLGEAEKAEETDDEKITLSAIQEERRRKVQMFLNRMKAKRENKLGLHEESSQTAGMTDEDVNGLQTSQALTPESSETNLGLAPQSSGTRDHPQIT